MTEKFPRFLLNILYALQKKTSQFQIYAFVRCAESDTINNVGILPKRMKKGIMLFLYVMQVSL